MSDKATVTSNDESRKEVKNDELKTNYVSDEEVRKSIEEWDDGKGIIVAAIAPEFIEIEITDQGNSSSSGTGSTSGRRKRVRVGAMAAKGIIELITDPLVTVGTKGQNEKTKKARENIKAKRAEKEEKEKE